MKFYGECSSWKFWNFWKFLIFQNFSLKRIESEVSTFIIELDGLEDLTWRIWRSDQFPKPLSYPSVSFLSRPNPVLCFLCLFRKLHNEFRAWIICLKWRHKLWRHKLWRHWLVSWHEYLIIITWIKVVISFRKILVHSNILPSRAKISEGR